MAVAAEDTSKRTLIVNNSTYGGESILSKQQHATNRPPPPPPPHPHHTHIATMQTTPAATLAILPAHAGALRTNAFEDAVLSRQSTSNIEAYEGNVLITCLLPKESHHADDPRGHSSDAWHRLQKGARQHQCSDEVHGCWHMTMLDRLQTDKLA